jgi:acetyl-CoA/propionyl-CoA carboxylase carboxyl transferase subunit
MTTTPTAPVKPAKLPREQDPRNPHHRLSALFDPGSLVLLSADDTSGMLAATGTIDRTHCVAFCSDATVMGGAMGDEGCKVVVRPTSARWRTARRSSGCGIQAVPGSPRGC